MPDDFDNVKICKFVPSSNITCYSHENEDTTSFPRTNITDYQFPLRPGKSTLGQPTTNAFRVQINTLVSGQVVKGFLMKDVNWLDCKVRTRAESIVGWSDPSSFGQESAAGTPASYGDELSYTISDIYLDERTQRRNLYYEFAADSSAKYFQFNTVTYSPASSADHYSTGSLFLITEIIELNYGFQSPFQVRRSKGVIRSDRVDGSANVIDLQIPRLYLTVPSVLPSLGNSDYATGGESQLLDIADSTLDEGIILYENRTRDNNQKSARAYQVRQSTDIALDFPATDEIIESSLELEEII